MHAGNFYYMPAGALLSVLKTDEARLESAFHEAVRGDRKAALDALYRPPTLCSEPREAQPPGVAARMCHPCSEDRATDLQQQQISIVRVPRGLKAGEWARAKAADGEWHRFQVPAAHKGRAALQFGGPNRPEIGAEPRRCAVLEAGLREVADETPSPDEEEKKSLNDAHMDKLRAKASALEEADAAEKKLAEARRRAQVADSRARAALEKQREVERRIADAARKPQTSSKKKSSKKKEKPSLNQMVHDEHVSPGAKSARSRDFNLRQELEAAKAAALREAVAAEREKALLDAIEKEKAVREQAIPHAHTLASFT
jgi:hypothetical protein